MAHLSRRDFLKLTSVASGVLASSKVGRQFSIRGLGETGTRPSILILVFDAMSAANLSVYGYRRRTTPNLERFAERANVYNAHYSPGSFTTPGSASLLSGLYPWTHRAINMGGLIARDRATQNLFHAVGGQYHRLAFSQNILCTYLLGQFQGDIEDFLSTASFSLVDRVFAGIPGRDLAMSHRVFDEFIFQQGTPPDALLFGFIARILLRQALAHVPISDDQRELPRTSGYPVIFRLKDLFDGLMRTVGQVDAPSLTYLHIWPPHEPFRASREFQAAFQDGWRPKEKPDHVLGGHITPRHTNSRRQAYDEYIADLDAQFGRLLDFLDETGALKTSYVVVTSDHGQLFERGEVGHVTRLLYDPVVRIPLLISSPGQTRRQDIDTPTVSVDLVPTVARLTGSGMPDWCEGQVLPALGGMADAQRRIFMMDAKENTAFHALRSGTFAIRTGQHKLICYRGYEQYGGKDHFELYDMSSDPEELHDLHSQNPSLGVALGDELLAKIAAENKSFGP